jgi:hypothetical protein
MDSTVVQLIVHVRSCKLVPMGGAVGVGVEITLKMELLGPLEQFPWVTDGR